MCRVGTVGGRADYYLGVDPSIANTGVVLLDSSGRLVATENGRNFIRGCHGFERYMNQARGIERFVSQNVELGATVHCGYEGYSFGSEHRALDLAEYGGILKHELLERNFCPIYLIAPALNKAFGTGNGMASKKAMREAAIAEELSLEGASDDICDAYFLAKFAAFVDGTRYNADASLLYRRASLAKQYREDMENGKASVLRVHGD